MKRLFLLVLALASMAPMSTAFGGTVSPPPTIANTPNLTYYLDKNAITRGALAVANETQFGNNPSLSSNGTDTSEMTRSCWTVTGTISDLVLLDQGGYLDGSGLTETVQPNDITITSAIEYPTGTYNKVFWQGATSLVLHPGAQVYSDPCPVTIPHSLTSAYNGGSNYTITSATSNQSFTCSAFNSTNLPTWLDPNAGDTIYFVTGVNAGLNAVLTGFTASTGVIQTGSGLSQPSAGDQFYIARHFWLRRYITVASGGMKWYFSHQVVNTNLEAIVANGGVDLTVTSGTINGNGRFMDPWCLLGRPVDHDIKSVAWVGDSIGNGAGDVITSGSGGGGLFVRAFKNNCGAVPICRDSFTAQNFASAGASRLRQFAAEHVQYLIDEMGTNDVTGNRTFSQLAQDLLVMWRSAAMRGVRVVPMTMLPKATSTDGWQTLGNQTLNGNDTVRQQVNDWIRAGGPVDSHGMPQTAGTGGTSPCGYVWAYLECADLLESARNSGKWAIPTTFAVSAPIGTVSGTTTTLTDSGAAWTTNQFTGWVVYITSGTGSGQVRPILSNTSTTITINALPNGTGATWTAPDNTSSYKIYNGLTVDGTHPTTTGHITMAATVTSMLGKMMPF